MINIILAVVLSVLITWALTKNSCKKSCRDIPMLAKELSPYGETMTDKAAAKLLLELIYKLENNKIYWREFTVFVKVMTRAAQTASDAIEHIYTMEAQRTVSTRQSPREAQSVRNMEIYKLRQDLEKQLNQ